MFGDRIGTLKAGKRADMILMDLWNIEEPYLDPESMLSSTGAGVSTWTRLSSMAKSSCGIGNSPR